MISGDRIQVAAPSLSYDGRTGTLIRLVGKSKSLWRISLDGEKSFREIDMHWVRENQVVIL